MAEGGVVMEAQRVERYNTGTGRRVQVPLPLMPVCFIASTDIDPRARSAGLRLG